MRKLIFLLSFLIICGNAYASKYVIERPDGSVTILEYIDSSTKSLQQVVIDSGLSGYPIHIADEANISSLDRKDRKYWKWNFLTKEVDIDSIKKQADIDSNIALEAEKAKVRQKMGITEKEWEDLNKKEIKV